MVGSREIKNMTLKGVMKNQLVFDPLQFDSVLFVFLDFKKNKNRRISLTHKRYYKRCLSNTQTLEFLNFSQQIQSLFLISYLKKWFFDPLIHRKNITKQPLRRCFIIILY